jgi:hypothetical protein
VRDHIGFEKLPIRISSPARFQSRPKASALPKQVCVVDIPNHPRVKAISLQEVFNPLGRITLCANTPQGSNRALVPDEGERNLIMRELRESPKRLFDPGTVDFVTQPKTILLAKSGLDTRHSVDVKGQRYQTACQLTQRVAECVLDVEHKGRRKHLLAKERRYELERLPNTLTANGRHAQPPALHLRGSITDPTVETLGAHAAFDLPHPFKATGRHDHRIGNHLVDLLELTWPRNLHSR